MDAYNLKYIAKQLRYHARFRDASDAKRLVEMGNSLDRFVDTKGETVFDMSRIKGKEKSEDY